MIAAAGVDRPHLVGHSLGGAVVTAAGSMLDVASVVDIDQSLQLEAFKEQLAPAEAMLRDPEQYQLVVDAMFEMMMGDLLDAVGGRPHQRPAPSGSRGGARRMGAVAHPTRRGDRCCGRCGARRVCAAETVPYLALFGLDPGDGYAGWLAERIPGAEVEYWADGDRPFGHYPHLVDPDRFVARLREFWDG